MTGTILIVDDEDLMREDLADLLRQRGHSCHTAATAEDALDRIARLQPDVVLTDIVMPGMNGIELTGHIKAVCPHATVLVMTAYGTMETAMEAFRSGATDYILKPIVVDDLVGKISRILENIRLTNEVSYLRRCVSEAAATSTMVGAGAGMRQVRALIDSVAPTRSTVLITGESGTGKELVARAVHDSGESPEQPFVAINCAGLKPELLESELFGHLKGSFTGANQNKQGLFQAAGHGTIFLDEISELPQALQGKFLRVLEEREFMPVGGIAAKPFAARLVAATNRDLKGMIAAGDFREDLYYRVAVFEIDLPPLRQRPGDIPLLVSHFVAKFNRELNRSCRGITPEATEALVSHNWPGNIRELRNVIERAMIICPTGESIDPACLPPQLLTRARSRPAESLKDAMNSYEATYIRQALDAAGWNKEETARRLRINPSTLYRKLADLGINAPDKP